MYMHILYIYAYINTHIHIYKYIRHYNKQDILYITYLCLVYHIIHLYITCTLHIYILYVIYIK